MKIKPLILAFAIFVSFQAIATQQIKEEFDVDSATFEIEEQPLDSFVGLKEFHEKFSPPLCSANWRGYKGYWALRDGKLWLTRLETDACSKNPVHLDAYKLFGGKNEYPVEAKWYTGKIIVRISEREYFGASDNGSPGVEYQAVVYEFRQGALVSRSIETVKELWEKTPN